MNGEDDDEVWEYRQRVIQLLEEITYRIDDVVDEVSSLYALYANATGKSASRKPKKRSSRVRK